MISSDTPFSLETASATIRISLFICQPRQHLKNQESRLPFQSTQSERDTPRHPRRARYPGPLFPEAGHETCAALHKDGAAARIFPHQQTAQTAPACRAAEIGRAHV